MNQAAREAALSGGISPLDFMLQMLRDEAAEIESRMWAAEKAAPYVHAKLASIESHNTHTLDGTVAGLMERIATSGRKIHDKDGRNAG